ncbi:MAG: hypothetical protein M1319_01375 [Chloroflexi bacterium]|nr:hypothetical protein [Chloroflexota bacterium]
MSWLAVKGFATSTVLGVTIPLSLGAVWIVFRSRNRRMEPIAIWGLLALGVVVVQFRFYQYHWLYALPASAVLSVVAVQRLMNTRVPRLRLALLIAYSVFSFLPLQVARLERDVPYFLGLESREQFLQHFHSDGDPVFATNPLADSDAADFIKSSLAPKDLVYAWNRPVVQFLSGAASPVRYDLIYPLVAGRGSYPQIVQEEILTSLRENPPRFLVIPSGDMVALKSSLTSTALQTLHQIVQIASTNFRLVHTDGDLLIYERLPQAPAVASSSTRLPFAVRTQPPSAHHCKI